MGTRGWGKAWTVRQGVGDPTAPRDLVFNAFAFDDRRERVEPLLAACPEGTSGRVLESLLGYMTPMYLAHTRESDREHDVVCWSEREFVTIEGCPHGCRYCWGGQLINLMLNLEEFADRVLRPALVEHPDQKCFRCNTSLSDTICFEPEYGLHETLLPVFAESGDYLYIHTSSANMDFLADVPNREHLIAVWSLTCDEVSRLIEPGAASGTERLLAARKCQELGLPVRFKFKPIVPIRGWREHYAALIEDLFRLTAPELVGFCVLMWMGAADLRACLGELLDPEYLRAAEAAAEQMRGSSQAPFPHEVRAEIYRFLIEQVRRWDARVPLFISTESRGMWDELAPLLGAPSLGAPPSLAARLPNRFRCACGPVCTPGPRLAGGQTATYAAEDGARETQVSP